MIELVFCTVWAMGIMFALGFCQQNDDKETRFDYIYYIAFVFFAWPMAIGIVLRQAIDKE